MEQHGHYCVPLKILYTNRVAPGSVTRQGGDAHGPCFYSLRRYRSPTGRSF